MSCHCTFEAKIQVSCVMEIITAIRSGDVLSNKGELLQHVGCVLGSLGAYIGPDSQLFAAVAVDMPCTIEEACDECEAAVVGAGEDGLMAINPAVLALILKLVELLISKYLG